MVAVQPGFHHPDAIFQYLEPAYRLLTGHGVVTWEWRVGMRGWLLPWLLAAPMALGRALDPGGGLYLVLPRVLAALGSLGSVWAAWTIGRRSSRLHAALAAFVAATWFEFVHFGAQTLSEPLATAALLPAAALLTGDRPRFRALLGAGALLGFAVLARPQYAPGAAVLALIACGRHWRQRWPAVIVGGLAALLVGALADLASGSVPLAWIAANVHQNLVAGKAAQFGVSPAWAYLAWWGGLWRGATVPIVLGLVRGRRHAPPLFWAAIVGVVLHSLIGHKEYRFVLAATTAIVILASLGWADWIAGLSRHRRLAAAAAFVIAGAASLALGLTGAAAEITAGGRPGATLFRDVAADPSACGVALLDLDWSEFPGQSGLDGRPLDAFMRDDPLLARGIGSHAAAWQTDYNRIVAPRPDTALVPAGFVRRRCEPRIWGEAPVCLWARPRGCTHRPSPFAINTVLARGGR